MSDGLARRAQRVFETLLAQPPTERLSRVGELCGDDQRLARRVEMLLAAHESAEGFLEEPLLEAALGLELSPRQLGGYRLLEVIARGGTSTVFRAVDVDDDSAEVAVKVVHGSLAAPELESRLLQEGTLLARLRHANIARLIDFGTERRVPYFVMEYIRGLPITEYCDRQALEIDARVRLLLTVCAAVHHAHQNRVLHRDIKPANILVSDNGTVTLLDFGIAKVLEAGESDGTTAVTRRILTPSYASPEHLAGRPTSPASDIYSLGILLYELLTGTRPYNGREMSPARLERLIARHAWPPPSARFDKAAGVASPAPTEVAERATRRGRPPDVLRNTIAGRLDAIVLRATRFEPELRYQSVAAMAEDLRRHLQGRDLQSLPINPFAHARRLLHRHPILTIVAALALLFLVAFATTTALQLESVAAQRDLAESERDRAELATRMLIESFELADPNRGGNESVTARRLLEESLRRADSIADHPLLQATMHHAIGSGFAKLGEYERARALLDSALTTREAELGVSREVEETLLALASVEHALTHFTEAEAITRRALELVRRQDPPDAARLANVLQLLAMTCNSLGRFDEAEALALEALSLHTTAALSSIQRIEIANDNDLLATIRHDRGDFAGAEAAAQRALESYRNELGSEHTAVARSQANLGYALLQQARYDAAEPHLRASLESHRRLLGEQHPLVATNLSFLGDLEYYQGRYPEAIELYRQSLTTLLASVGPRHHRVAVAKNNLANALYRVGDYDQGEALQREALELRREILGDDHPEVAQALNNLAGQRLGQGDYDGAEALYGEARDSFARAFGDDAWQVGDVVSNLAWVVRCQGRVEEAEVLYRSAESILLQLGEEHPKVSHARNGLAWVLLSRGRIAESEALLRDLVAARERLHGGEHPALADSQTLLADLLRQTRRAAEAEGLIGRALAIYERTVPPGHWRIAAARSVEGAIRRQLGAGPAALQEMRAAHGVLLAELGELAVPTREAAARLAGSG